MNTPETEAKNDLNLCWHLAREGERFMSTLASMIGYVPDNDRDLRAGPRVMHQIASKIGDMVDTYTEGYRDSRYARVTDEELQKFVQNYAEPLETDTARMSEPAVTSYNRRNSGLQWPECVVARRVLHSELGGEDVCEVRLWKFYVEKTDPRGEVYSVGQFYAFNEDDAIAQAKGKADPQEKGYTYGIRTGRPDAAQRARDAALTLTNRWSIGTTSQFCDESDWDSADPKEIAEALTPFFENIEN